MTVKNEEYWRQRFTELVGRQLDKGDDYYDQLASEYLRTIKSLDTDIRYWYNRLAENNNVTIAEARRLLNKGELKEFKWSVEEYIKRGRLYGIDKSWAKELENASARVHISRYESLKIQMRQHLEELTTKRLDGMGSLMDDVYEDTFYRSAFELQKGFGVGTRLDRIDPREIEKILDTPWTADGRNFSSRIWTDKKKLIRTLNTELKQGLMRGDSIDKITSIIADKMNVSKRRAGTLARTEAAYFSSRAQQKAFNDLDVEQFQLDATLDTKTSKKCQGLDQKVCNMRDYEAGVTAPPFHGNCRTVAVPYFDDEFTQDEVRAARGQDRGIYNVPGDMKYKNWYNKYVPHPTGKGD